MTVLLSPEARKDLTHDSNLTFLILLRHRKDGELNQYIDLTLHLFCSEIKKFTKIQFLCHNNLHQKI